GAEAEQLERTEGLAARARVHLMAVDIGEARDGRIRLEVRSIAREARRPVQLRIGLWVHGRAVGKSGRDVHALRGEGQLGRLRRSAHREQEPAAPYVLADRPSWPSPRRSEEHTSELQSRFALV